MRRLTLALLLPGCIPSFTSVDTGDTDPNAVWAAPENGWEMCADGPAEGLVGQGYEVGMVLPDVRLPDQFEKTTSLWEFAGCVTVLDLSTIWCAPCQELAPHLEDIHVDYEERGIRTVTMHAEDIEGAPPDTADLNSWVDAFGLASPVLGDAAKTFSNPMLQNDAYPVVLVIDTDLTVAKRLTGSDPEGIRAAIDELLD